MANSIFVLTGAGISAESGLGTFRDKDGQGRKITSALYESSAFLVGQHMAGEAATGTPSPPMPARSGAWGIYETFPTLNGERLDEERDDEKPADSGGFGGGARG